jgi:hypothetical protein
MGSDLHLEADRQVHLSGQRKGECLHPHKPLSNTLKLKSELGDSLRGSGAPAGTCQLSSRVHLVQIDDKIR